MDRWKNIIFVLERTRNFRFFSVISGRIVIVVGDCREPVASGVVSAGDAGLQLGQDRLVLLLDDLTDVCLIFVPFGIPPGSYRARTFFLHKLRSTSLETRLALSTFLPFLRIEGLRTLSLFFKKS